MLSAQIEQDRQSSYRKSEGLKEEVAALTAQLAALEQEQLRSFPLFRKLRRYFGFGVAGKLDWARFKLDFKREELDRCEAQFEEVKITVPAVDRAPEPRPSLPGGLAGETARQKMERMIAQNPAPLAPHIRRVYRPLIEAEQERAT